MGLALDGIGRCAEVGVEENAEGFEIRNRSGVELPGISGSSVITRPRCGHTQSMRPSRACQSNWSEDRFPGSGIGSSTASWLRRSMVSTNCWAVRFGKQLVEFAMMGEALNGTPHAILMSVRPYWAVWCPGYEPFDIVKAACADNFFYAVAHPGVVSTPRTREVLLSKSPVECHYAVGATSADWSPEVLH